MLKRSWQDAEAVSSRVALTRINVTPIIDVALVLVIILLVTAPMLAVADLEIGHRPGGQRAELPVGDPTPAGSVAIEPDDEETLGLVPFGGAGALHRARVEDRRREPPLVEIVGENLVAVDVATQHRRETRRDRRADRPRRGWHANVGP